MSGMAAIWSLTFLTMERTWVIHSISKTGNHRLSMGKMRVVVIFIWIAAVLTSLAPLLGWNKYVYEVRGNMASVFLINCFGFFSY